MTPLDKYLVEVKERLVKADAPVLDFIGSARTDVDRRVKMVEAVVSTLRETHPRGYHAGMDYDEEDCEICGLYDLLDRIAGEGGT